MDIKKIGIAGLIGFVVHAVFGAVSFPLFYEAHLTTLAGKFPEVVQFPPNMAVAALGGIMYVFVMAIIYDKMGVDSVEGGAITGAWFGAAKWTFINTQFMALMPNVFEAKFVVIDILISTVMYAVAGAAMGWALNRFK